MLLKLSNHRALETTQPFISPLRVNQINKNIQEAYLQPCSGMFKMKLNSIQNFNCEVITGKLGMEGNCSKRSSTQLIWEDSAWVTWEWQWSDLSFWRSDCNYCGKINFLSSCHEYINRKLQGHTFQSTYCEKADLRALIHTHTSSEYLASALQHPSAEFNQVINPFSC